jgi:hypothetical protein
MYLMFVKRTWSGVSKFGVFCASFFLVLIALTEDDALVLYP